MKFFDKEKTENTLNYPDLIEEIRQGFINPPEVPSRLHYHFDNPVNNTENTLLFMPAWKIGKNIGVKLLTVAPQNQQYNLGSIQGIYILFNAITGVTEAIIDAKTLTNWRTACTSALASMFLSREDSETLLMVGTGDLAPYLVKAHASIRSIKNVLIWGRNRSKANQLKESLSNDKFSVKTVESIQEGIDKADIISCATLSSNPLIKGGLLKQGQHLDMVGAFKPTLREADDEVLKRADIYVDHLEIAVIETGDLAIPIREGNLKITDIKGDLFELCKKETEGRIDMNTITMFKSVGHALEDFVAARLVIKNSVKNNE